MGQAIKVLMTEDMPDDAELEVCVLRKAGFEVNAIRVDSEEDFRRHLDSFNPDLLLSDFSVPGFSGLFALQIARQKRPDIPFIFVSGTIGEERAIESFRSGATDYVIKTNLDRLGPVVQRALDEAARRKACSKAELDLMESEEKFRVIVETSREWIWEVDKQGHCTFTSPFAHVLLGYYTEELLGADRLAHIHPQDREKIETLMFAGPDAEKHGWNDVVLRWRRKDGSYRWLESSAIPLFDNAGNVFGYRGADRDVTERIRHEEKIARMSRIHTVLSEINAAIVRVHNRKDLFRQICRIAVEQGGFRMAWTGLPDHSGVQVRPVAWMGFEEGYLDEVDFCLRNAAEDLGAAGQALRDKKMIVISNIETDPQGKAFKAEALRRGYRSLVVLPLLVEGEVVAVMVLYAAQPDFFDEQELKLLNNLAGDISFALDHLAREERLDYLSHHDPLTKLPNRALFQDRLGQYLQIAGQEDRKLAVLFIDLERFRNINETLGRQAGDELLKLIAGRLTVALRNCGEPARIGSDCFAITIPDVKDEADIAHLVEEKICRALLQPLTLAEVELRITAKVGIAVFPTDGDSAETLIMNAESSLKKAKTASERYLFYTPQMHTRVAEQLTLEHQLRRALEEEQFVLYYQPKVSLADGHITSMEALIRWQSPELGLVSPGTFVPLLEETGLILDVGRWVLEKAAVDYSTLLTEQIKPPRIAVNVSALQLRQKGFVKEFADTFEKGGLDLEVTETLLMEDLEGSVAKLNLIRTMGVGIALDDFGTGFSSLSYLVKLPIDYLKIDRAFIINMTQGANDMTIVSAVIALAHSLGLKVIAEGVETEQQANLLRLLKCDEMQGYFFSRPISLKDIQIMLSNTASAS